MKINIVLPSFPIRPGGGHKIMYEYANRLFEAGHDVVVYHSLFVPYTKYRMPLFFRYIRIHLLHPGSRPKWFQINKKIKTKTITHISNKTIRNSDILMSTNFAAAFEIARLSKNKGAKVNLIQGFETWNTDEKIVLKSYKLPIHHIVINDYLQTIVKNVTKSSPLLIYNAVDINVLNLKNEIEKRFPHSICMLYSEENHKGSRYGIEALKKCKEIYPDTKVTFFSTFSRPKELPYWINFIQTPNNLTEIYNDAAIFISPSLTEGWALPPAEAMCCGCAVICTDIGGHAAYAKNNDTALLVEPGNSEDLFLKICDLFENNEKRINIAKNGNKLVQSFSWEKNIRTLINYFNDLILNK
ncbi:MAG: D-inositol 3-phosphate glycosyltransferase [Bacteroidetes bacterium ADurb.BinA395]|nr:MAG: D-inositol 3-phosphate glycosyltransferase [Bacteroidetes bacterium ADurb.BinA395]